MLSKSQINTSMKGKHITSIIGLVIGLIILWLYVPSPIVKSKHQANEHDEKINKILLYKDSLQKENESLKVERTILIQEAKDLQHSLDSLSLIRPKNVKHTNNAVSRLHNSDITGKLSIIDSIIRARKGQR